MKQTEVILSDEASCMVRKLGLFELKDAVQAPIQGPFVYEINIGNNTIKAEYDLDAWQEPPQKPPISQASVTENTVAWHEWREYQFYQAAVLFETEKREDYKRYFYDVALYVLATCISKEDRKRVLTAEDYQKIYLAAMVPQLTIFHLQTIAAQSYKAEFDDIPVLQALLEKESEGNGKYDALMVWENQTMLLGGFTEQVWAELSLAERARKVIAHKIDDWLSELQWELDKTRK